jgi:ribosomal subunit interface protein
MNKQITFRGMDHSPVIEQHTNEQLSKLERFLEHEREPIYLHIVLEAERTHHHHKIEIGLKSPHYDLHVHKEGPEFYKVLDEAIDTMYHNVHEAKRELIDKKKSGHRND